MNNLKNKTALVTGSSRGIGEAIAKKMAENGAYVIVHYSKSQEKAIAVQKEVLFNGGKADLVQTDFSDSDNLSIFFQKMEKILDRQKLDILVNNAAIPNPANLLDLNEEQFDQLFGINVKTPFLLTRWAADHMNDGGRIINISSTVSRKPSHQSGVYAMTKAALDNFTVQLASLLGPRKITVNSVAPGPILTDMNKKHFAKKEIRKWMENQAALKGIGNPVDVAGIVTFLASPDAGWITGQWIEVSGGLNC